MDSRYLFFVSRFSISLSTKNIKLPFNDMCLDFPKSRYYPSQAHKTANSPVYCQLIVQSSSRLLIEMT